jgi:hypothetical protein
VKENVVYLLYDLAHTQPFTRDRDTRSFDFTPQEVMAFCEECVLSDSEEPCNVPEAFFGNDKAGGLRP